MSLSVAALILVAMSSAHASEVTGNLSSGNTAYGDDVNGSISGTVTSPNTTSNSNSGGSSGRSNSSSTNTTGTSGDVDVSAESSLSSDGTSLVARSGPLAFATTAEGATDEVTLALASISGTEDSNSSLTASALDASRGLSFGNWIWISLLLLLLIAVATYMYYQSQGDKRSVVRY